MAEKRRSPDRQTADYVSSQGPRDTPDIVEIASQMDARRTAQGSAISSIRPEHQPVTMQKFIKRVFGFEKGTKDSVLKSNERSASPSEIVIQNQQSFKDEDES